MYEGTDRTRQVNEIRRIADSIVNYDADGTADAEEIVSFWEMQQTPGKPQWFDASDRRLLVRFVDELIS